MIYGHSVRSTAGMSNIRRMIGVCPQVGALNIVILLMHVNWSKEDKHSWFISLQFDILWDALTAKEHMELFASIKGLPTSTIKSVCFFRTDYTYSSLKHLI